MAQGDIVHMDIPSDDIERATRFYEGVFGWRIEAVPGFDDFHMGQPGTNGVTGGIGKRGQTAPDRHRTYIEVDSIEAALPKVTELGGSVVVEKTEVPGMGWYAAVEDSEGGEIGLWEIAAG